MSVEERAPARGQRCCPAAIRSRRGLLAVLAPALVPVLGGLGLGACGFRPLNARGGRPGTDGAAASELAAVRVGVIPDRNGQLLRRDIQDGLASGGAGTAARYDLKVALQIGADPQGFRRDGTPSRIRLNVVAPWSLYTMAVPPVLVAGGTERAFDAFNLPDNQFFAADASQDAAQRRLVRRIADDVVEKVAVALSGRTPA